MNRRAFTLIELVLAMAACTVILIAIYSVFSKAVHLRDDATARTREARVRSRAVSVIRNDLRNARISGGKLAATLQGSAQAPGGSFPGYLKFVTTTGTDAEELPAPDLQQVEYYIVDDPQIGEQKSGQLVRACTRNLLATTTEEAVEERLLPGLKSMEITFYDGTTWQSSWDYAASSTLPQAVRVRLEPAASERQNLAAIEVVVPWTTQLAIAAPAATATGGTP